MVTFTVRANLDQRRRAALSGLFNVEMLLRRHRCRLPGVRRREKQKDSFR